MHHANGTYFSEQHSISFGKIMLSINNGAIQSVFEELANTWTDWHLIPSSRPSIANPSVVTKYVDIPGHDGFYDLTEFLSGKPNYGKREGTLQFIVDNNHESWEVIRQKIVNFLHGKEMQMRLQDDPQYYYSGRFTVGNWESGADHSSISISYQLYPFKHKIEAEGSDHPTLWDQFCFEADYDYSILSPVISVNNTPKTFNIHAEEYGFSMIATWVSGHVTVSFGGVTRTLSSPDTVELGISHYGNNILSVTGIGSIKVNWRGGSL